MKSRDEWMLMEADDGGGGGYGGPGGGGEMGAPGPQEGARGAAVFEEGGGSGGPSREAPRGSEGPGQGPPMQSQPTVDARQLANEFGQVIGQHFQPPQREITVEEAKRLLNVWEPTPEWLAKYDNLETRGQAIAEHRDGLIRQADTIMQYRMREMQNAMEQRYAPVVAYMHQMEARAGEHRFSQNYPQLDNPALRPLLYSVAQSMLASGMNFRSEEEMFNALARGVESVIKVNNPAFSLEAGNGANGGGGGRPVGGAPQRPVGALPVTTPGSGGGSGNRAPATAKPRGLAIFD
jgi:hypothetical protein